MRPQRHEAISDDHTAQGFVASQVGATSSSSEDQRFGERLLAVFASLEGGTAERIVGAILHAHELARGSDALISHEELAALAGCSISTAGRATRKAARRGTVAIAPGPVKYGHRTANTYAVLALPVARWSEPQVKMTERHVTVSAQQKEIPEETVVRAADPVDNCPAVDDPTPEDRAALAAVGRGLKFPEPENVPEPVRGSPLELVCARWGWLHYGQVWQFLQSREGQQLAHVAAPALAALLRRSAAQVPNPTGYVRTTMRTMAKAGPGLRSIRPAPDTPAPGSLAELELQFATLRGLRDSSVGDPDRYGQLCIAVHELGRRIVARKAKAS